MNRQGVWIWLLLLGLLVLLGPGRAAHLLLDLLGGLTLTVLLLPLLAAGAGLIGWQLLRIRMRTCPSCGLTSLAVERCPACGTSLDAGNESFSARSPAEGSAGAPWGEAPPLLDARDVTIDVEARAVDAPEDRGSPR